MIKNMIILALPGVQLLDVSGPLDVFAEANEQLGRQVYGLRVMGWERGLIQSSSGVKLMSDLALDDEMTEPVDSFLVAGAPGIRSFIADAALLMGLRRWALNSRRFGSVCSGALMLAAAGLLNGRHVATHWAVAGYLADTYPEVTVDADAISLSDGPVRSAAGVTSGLDLALSMVEEDVGRETALAVAAQLVMYFKRPGGQSQFSRKGHASLTGRSALQDLQRYVQAHLSESHNVQTMAARMSLSPRHFNRLYQQQIGQTPGEWLEQTRVDHARRLLETGELPLKQIAAACGFSSTDILRRAFVRQLNTTPAQYRKFFATSGTVS
ncbi:helix-turn-helix domain-containing protein [Sodalis sp. dw_96]|uniref:GlxA family transcriptional regulator n=1 Tax=Sodalis sp. dw_96 TaxID=2719794 RepID=UPI001BD212AC|nr:helix-turn-helix domain-containing protein [Sodalis sp. dw_96]